MAMSTHEFVNRQTKKTRESRGSNIFQSAADYRHGSSDGEVAWRWVGCHTESGEVVDASILALLHSVLLIGWLRGWVVKLTRWLGGEVAAARVVRCYWREC